MSSADKKSSPESKSVFGSPLMKKLVIGLALFGAVLVIVGFFYSDKIAKAIPGNAPAEAPLEEMFDAGKEPMDSADQCENPTLTASEIGIYCNYEYVKGSTKTHEDALKTLEIGFRKADEECSRIETLENEGKVVDDSDSCRLYQTYSQEFLARYAEAMDEKDHDAFIQLKKTEKDPLRLRIIGLILSEAN